MVSLKNLFMITFVSHKMFLFVLEFKGIEYISIFLLDLCFLLLNKIIFYSNVIEIVFHPRFICFHCVKQISNFAFPHKESILYFFWDHQHLLDLGFTHD